MIELYYSPGAASLVVHWLLLDMGVPHRLRRLDLASQEQKRAEYLAINPRGVVPTLCVDGAPIYESGAIIMHLADAYPQAGLAPQPGTLERARYYQWIVHLANALMPPFRHWYYPTEAAGEAASEAAQRSAAAAIETEFSRIDAHLAKGGPYLLGEAPSAADFLLTMLMRWSRNLPRPATQWPHLARLAELMKARPSFRQLYAIEGLTEWS